MVDDVCKRKPQPGLAEAFVLGCGGDRFLTQQEELLEPNRCRLNRERTLAVPKRDTERKGDYAPAIRHYCVIQKSLQLNKSDCD
jgi:hypothetical protein